MYAKRGIKKTRAVSIVINGGLKLIAQLRSIRFFTAPLTVIERGVNVAQTEPFQRRFRGTNRPARFFGSDFASIAPHVVARTAAVRIRHTPLAIGCAARLTTLSEAIRCIVASKTQLCICSITIAKGGDTGIFDAAGAHRSLLAMIHSLKITIEGVYFRRPSSFNTLFFFNLHRRSILVQLRMLTACFKRWSNSNGGTEPKRSHLN